MPLILPRTFPNLLQCDVFSQASLESHLRLYEGYVRKYNELADKLAALYHRGPPVANPDAESLKTDITFALSAIKNHELYFDLLGPESDGPEGELAETFVKSFHSLPQFLVDLKQTALLGRGWAFSAYDLDYDTVCNYEAGGQNGLPVWNTVPLLTIDLYGHAYFYDFGNNRLAYVESLMKALNWTKIGERLIAAVSARGKAAIESP